VDVNAAKLRHFKKIFFDNFPVSDDNEEVGMKGLQNAGKFRCGGFFGLENRDVGDSFLSDLFDRRR
jgi:hypothetical protein